VVALSILSSLRQELGDLDRIKRVVRLMGMVNVVQGFDRMPEVILLTSTILSRTALRKYKTCPVISPFGKREIRLRDQSSRWT
jgi:hypothetical protein